MSVSGTAVRAPNEPPRDGSIWMAIPSWVISLLFHGGVLALFAMTFRQPATIGDPDADARVVGIYHKSSAAEPGLPGAGTAMADSPAGAEGPNPAIASPKIDEIPPVELDLPTILSPRIGPGATWPGDPAFRDTGAAAPRDAREMVKSSGTGFGGGQTGAGGAGGGETTFFGQRATGRRFVYVLDASGSMQDYNALGVAKAELLASLAQLDADQQFQILFYSERCYPMVHPDGRSKFFAATDVNRTKASQFVRGISPLEGTRHLEALLMALNYNPDVIYFLTDAGEPKLYPADLERIRKRNGEKAQIHAVEFGKHANLNIDSNFVKKLARENRGGYVYRDITQFRREREQGGGRVDR